MISVVADMFEIHPQTLRAYEREGLLRGHVKKQDRFEDYVVYGLLREDFAFQGG
jgi:DNA-binding transcriptional MerR regulator